MKSTKSAIRYSKALLEMAIEQKMVDSVLFDMSRVKGTADVSSEFVSFLNSPIIKNDKKIAIIDKLFTYSWIHRFNR